MSGDGNSGLDGVRLAVMTNRVEGIVRRMKNTLLRTGRSGVLNTAADFSCCILTKDDELLAMAESLPIHVMVGPDLMAAHMKSVHPNLRRGDAFLHNSPYHGNSHPADHSILTPVIDDDGVHRFTVLTKAHQADCGNSKPTTYMADARDVYEEGALIFPSVQVQRDYEDIDDIIRMCELRIRVPEQWRGDYLGLLGAARIGERLLLELAEEVGWDALDEYVREWLDYSEQRMSMALRRLPTASASAVSVHDPFPGVPDGVPVKASLAVDGEAGTVDVDLRDNPDCLPCGLNLPEATARTAAMIGVFDSIDHTVPRNAGSFRRVRIQLRENCAVGIPRHPASCSVGTTNLMDRAANAVLMAMSQLEEGVGMAHVGLCQPASLGVISGHDERRGGAPFVNQLFFPSATCGAASPVADGWLTTLNIGCAGVVNRDSVEIAEQRHPILVREQGIVADSEGAGRHRGAPAGRVEYGPVGRPLHVHYSSDGTHNPAEGVRGGLGGAASQHFKRRADGELEELANAAYVELQPGETIVSLSCGGGGYGAPSERDPAAVARDAGEGWISRERAERVYAVALGADGAVDQSATTALRGGQR
jgi:N-methylhydantoinase B